ncbi:MAG: ABC transporter ATP-binding protein [Gammaproteobacteria bacterium]|nr:MAG: ABC transporter ATP-binding protein [Gammaproteobacteria bacterium]
MIEVQSLTRCYGKTIAVDNVSFHISDNEIVGLLGHNGAGKTTIMKMLSGYLEPTAGSIVISGIDLTTQAQIVQQQLGYLPENPPVYPEMMVADYLDYAATLKGISKKERCQAVRGAILATDLAQRALDPISTLSRGLRQRVGVAQAVLGRPRLLILDEPTNGLDPNQTEHMRQLIKKLARRATIILSTHIMQEVDAICDRVLILRNGQLALDQRMRDLHYSRTLQLRTNAAVESLASYLRRMPQVASLKQSSPEDGLMQFSLQLHQNADMDTAANNIAKCVIEVGARLYQLQPVARDLSSVFREVNTGGD